MMTALLLRAIDQQHREHVAATSVPAGDVRTQVAELVDRLIAEHGATAVSAALSSGPGAPTPTHY